MAVVDGKQGIADQRAGERRDRDERGEPGVLVAHTWHGVIEIPLTGDDQLDALLEGFASRGACTVKRRAP